jgi:hypothetical protein
VVDLAVPLATYEPIYLPRWFLCQSNALTSRFANPQPRQHVVADSLIPLNLQQTQVLH